MIWTLKCMEHLNNYFDENIISNCCKKNIKLAVDNDVRKLLELPFIFLQIYANNLLRYAQ